MAFALEKYATGEIMTNPRYLKWAAILWEYAGDEKRKVEVPMQPCTEEDYDQFFPVEESSKKRL